MSPVVIELSDTPAAACAEIVPPSGVPAGIVRTVSTVCVAGVPYCRTLTRTRLSPTLMPLGASTRTMVASVRTAEYKPFSSTEMICGFSMP
jgi:hypothetical protein